MRCLERISIAGNVYQLMQLNDFSVLNTKKWDDFAWTQQDNYPSYITSFGYNFRNIFTSEFITDNTSYSGYIDGTSCYFRKYRVYYSSSDAPNYVEIVIPNLPSGTPQIRQGYTEDMENIYVAIVVDDEEQEAYIILVTNSSVWKKACLLYDTPSSRTKVVYQQLKNGFNIKFTANGGGATHIAKVTGQLSSLSNNLSDILMVSGGGGGGLIIGEDTYAGKDAGGVSGSGNNSGNQSTGYAFGQGESADGVSGGGGGLYGGYKGGTS